MFFFDFILMFWCLTSYSFISYVTYFTPIEYLPTTILAKGMHLLRTYWLGLERCIACRMCDLICPSLAIHLRCSGGFLGTRYAEWFSISYRRCIYCGFCMHVCPTDAITHSYVLFTLTAFQSYLILPKHALTALSFVVFDFFLLYN